MTTTTVMALSEYGGDAVLCAVRLKAALVDETITFGYRSTKIDTMQAAIVTVVAVKAKPSRRGCRVVRGEIEGRVGGRDHHVRVQVHEDRYDAGRDRDRGRGKGKALAVVIDQPGRGQGGQDSEQLDHVEEEPAVGGHVRPDDEADDERAGERGDAAGQLPGPLVYVAGGLEAEERRAVQQAGQDQGDPGEHAVGLEQVPE